MKYLYPRKCEIINLEGFIRENNVAGVNSLPLSLLGQRYTLEFNKPSATMILKIYTIRVIRRNGIFPFMRSRPNTIPKFPFSNVML